MKYLLAQNPDGSVPTPTPDMPPVETPVATPESTGAVSRTQPPQVIISPSSTPTPTASVIIQPTITPSPLPLPQVSSNSDVSMVLIGGVVAAIGFIGIAGYLKQKKNKNTKDENSCDSIREALEQKKEELKEFAKTYPQEKLKEMAANQNETTAQILDTYNKITETIELIENRLNLCMMTFPESAKSDRVIIIGPSGSGKTTLANNIRSQNNTLSVLEMDELLVQENGGTYPVDADIKHKDLAPKIINKVLDQEKIVFLTNTDYFSHEDLIAARKKGFKVIQLSLGEEELKKRIKDRTQNDGYEDQSVWIQGMLKYQEDIERKNLVDKVIDASRPTKDLTKDVLGCIK